MKLSTILLLLPLLAAAGQAVADSATITVTGRVLPGTCTLTPGIPVVLDEISATDLKSGHDNGLKPAVLAFTGCVGVSSIDLTFDGAVDATQDGHWQNQVADGATGVAVALLEGTRGTTFLQKGTKRTITLKGAADGKLDVRAGYFRKAGTLLKAGELSAQITVTAAYR